MTQQLQTKNGEQLARPLKTLVPLIKDEIRLGDEAGLEHYRAAGAMLLEAKSQIPHGEFVSWSSRNFKRSQGTLIDWMKLAKIKKSRMRQFSSIRQALGETGIGSGKPAWQAPVQDVLKQVRAEAFNLRQHEISQTKEKQLERKLGLQLIDIGYKVLSVKMHPDKGGSHEAMQRLNRVRNILKEAL